MTAAGRLDGIEIAIAAMDFSFIGGSMGSVVGEKISRACRLALQRSSLCHCKPIGGCPYAGRHLLVDANGQDLHSPSEAT
ncbi:MAG: hypothetical protein Ct9H300mP15_08750 [Gemmatimonadota bacterium]|nr:MAG: hypothetical protein Ct9H300mP15_08750 [Gemmatimonadota bacterium]